MIKLSRPLPHDICIAVSGGVDSMAALDFLRRKHRVRALHVNHGDEGADAAERCVRDFCASKQVSFVGAVITEEKPDYQSLEEFWREERLRFFWKFDPVPVITAHHLDDVAETWLWSSCCGEGKIIPGQFKNVIRPFLACRKSELEAWAQRNDVPHVPDPSSARSMRGVIRRGLLPAALEVNPGLHKTLAKRL